MSEFVRVCSESVLGLRNLLPVLATLVAVRTGRVFIATSIAGLGPCKSTFCKPERRVGAEIR